MEQADTMTADTSPDSTESTPHSISDCEEHQKSSMPLFSQENQSEIVLSQQKDQANLPNGICNGEKTSGLFWHEDTNGCEWAIKVAGSINPSPQAQNGADSVRATSTQPTTVGAFKLGLLWFCPMRKKFIKLIYRNHCNTVYALIRDLLASSGLLNWPKITYRPQLSGCRGLLGDGSVYYMYGLLRLNM